MADKQPEKADPLMGIRKFAGPTKFDWMALTWKDPLLVIRPPWLGKWSLPKPRYPPSLVTGKPPKRWPLDRMPELSYIYVNVVLFRGLEGVQVLFVPLPLMAVEVFFFAQQAWKAVGSKLFRSTSMVWSSTFLFLVHWAVK